VSYEHPKCVYLGGGTLYSTSQEVAKQWLCNQKLKIIYHSFISQSVELNDKVRDTENIKTSLQRRMPYRYFAN
jgi:hypothetical protein